MKKLAKTVRVLTVPPFMALMALAALFAAQPGLFGGTVNFVLAVLFLTAFPLLAYPLQPLVPGFRGKGRDGQRNLAMLFSVAGYVGGVVSALFAHAPKNMLIIYIVYLISGAFILISDKVLGFKASGHACGIAGPFALLVSFGQACGLLGIPVLLAAFWASLKIKRHTVGQLIGGAAVPVVSLALVLFAAG